MLRRYIIKLDSMNTEYFPIFTNIFNNIEQIHFAIQTKKMGKFHKIKKEKLNNSYLCQKYIFLHFTSFFRYFKYAEENRFYVFTGGCMGVHSKQNFCFFSFNLTNLDIASQRDIMGQPTRMDYLPSNI